MRKETNLKKESVILLTDRADSFVFDRLSTLSRATDDSAVLCVDRSNLGGRSLSRDSVYTTFCLEELITIGYQPIEDALIPGSNHFPIIEITAHGHAEFAWCVEYDALFNGDWRTFFERQSHSDADLLAAYIETREYDPDWWWWKTLQGPDGEAPLLPQSRWFRSFNPVYRISKRAAQYMRRMFLHGWRGHHEVSMATLLMMGGYRIEDFGGSGRFVGPHNRGKWYSIDTYRHAGTPGAIDSSTHSMLFHPVKSAELVVPQASSPCVEDER